MGIGSKQIGWSQEANLLYQVAKQLEILSSTIAANGGGGEAVNKAFTTQPFASTINRVHDPENPNFEIDLTGNLSLTITGTTNGDSGIVNLYFAGSQTATLNGFTPLTVVGATNMIPVYFIHDTDGLKWYRDGADITTLGKTFAFKEGTVLHHIKLAPSTGTFSNVGNVGTGTGMNLNDFFPVGAKITKANGEVAIIASFTGNNSFTTVEPFATNSVGTTYTLQLMSMRVMTTGVIEFYDWNEGSTRLQIGTSGDVTINGLTAQSNSIVNFANALVIGNTRIASDSFQPNYSSFANDAAADAALPSKACYKLNGNRTVFQRP